MTTKEKPITVGDLVMVIKPSPCCKNASDIGYIFEVKSIVTNSGHCEYCGKKDESLVAYSGLYPFRMYRLKRIPPLDELESQPSKEALVEQI